MHAKRVFREHANAIWLCVHQEGRFRNECATDESGAGVARAHGPRFGGHVGEHCNASLLTALWAGLQLRIFTPHAGGL
jgi:hypothetical protein